MFRRFLVLRDIVLIFFASSRKNVEVFKKYMDRYGPNNLWKVNIGGYVSAKLEKTTILVDISIMFRRFHILGDINLISLPFKRSSSELLKKYNDHRSDSPVEKVRISEKSNQNHENR